MYLYDLQSGKVKRQITSGEGNVTQLVRVDEKRRLVFVQAVGDEKGRDPYFTFLYKVNMDGGQLALLTPEDATHESPCRTPAIISWTATRRRSVPPWRCSAT